MTIVTHKQYVNVSTKDAAHLSLPDGRHFVIKPLSTSKRIRIFDGVEPSVVWSVCKVCVRKNNV